MARVAIIMPNCLRVDRAMIFFKSDSSIAAIPAINIVREANRERVVLKYGDRDKNG